MRLNLLELPDQSMPGEEKNDGPTLQLGRPKQQAKDEEQPVTADASCLAWIQSKLELVCTNAVQEQLT